MSLAQEAPEIAAVLRPSWYIGVSTVTLLTYDYLITLEREVRLIWPSSWSTIKVFFLLARYLPFVDISLVLLYSFDTSLSENGCRMSISISNWVLVAAIAFSEGILCMRTWAIWNKATKITIMLSVIITLALTLVIAFVAIWMKSLTFVQAAGLGGAACLTIGPSRADAVGLAAIMFVELVVLTLTVTRLSRQYRFFGRRAFLRGATGILYRDGIIFFVYMFALSMGNLLVVLLGSELIRNDLIIMQHVLHSVLSARVLFHLREAMNKRESDSEDGRGIVLVTFSSGPSV